MDKPIGNPIDKQTGKPIGNPPIKNPMAARPTAVTVEKISEAAIRKQVTEYLRLRGWFVWYQLQGLGAYRGSPDLMAAKDGKTIAVELKKAKGYQSEKQKQFQDDYENAGCVYILTRGIEDLQQHGI